MQYILRALGALFCILAFIAPLVAQPAGPNPESLKHARAGFDYEQKHEYQLALYEYDTSAKLDPKYPYPVERIGGMYQVLKNYKLAIAFYEHAIKLDSNFDVYNYYNLGLAYRIVEKHDSAVSALREFLRRMDPVNHSDTVAMKDADWWIKFNLGCIVEKAKAKNTDEPVALSELNSTYDDFGPTVTADGLTLYFTSRRPGMNAKQEIETSDYGDDLFVSHRDTAGHWSKPMTLPAPINSIDDEGAATVSADGQSLYFSLCRRPDGIGDCDLYHSELVGDQWTKPANYGRPLNSESWDAQPTVTADGNTMYFSSKRRGSIEGSEDIYVSYKSPGGTWTTPQNIGEPVNTRFSEHSPFISADGKTLYFASNGHPGFGNHDLFMSRMLDDGTWSEPINLGSPINSYGDDAFLTIPARGDKVIYSSQRANARGDLNLYEAVLPLNFRPGPITLVAGTVYDKKTHQPIGAKIEVNDLKADQVVATYRSNKVTGKFYITLGTGKMYGITAQADGYVHFSDNYLVPDTISFREVTHDLPLDQLPNYAAITSGGPVGKGLPNGGASDTSYKNAGGNDGGKQKGGNVHGGDTTSGNINSSGARGGNINNGDTSGGAINSGGNIGNKNGKNTGDNGKNSGNSGKNGATGGTTKEGGNEAIGGAIELHNVFFDFNKSDLRPESHTELRYLIDMMKEHTVYRIEIDGHTDSVGTSAYNMKLSEARAKAVREYMVKQGVVAKRITARGFGATKPMDTNATEEGRQRNRRTEFRFIK